MDSLQGDRTELSHGAGVVHLMPAPVGRLTRVSLPAIEGTHYGTLAEPSVSRNAYPGSLRQLPAAYPSG